MAHSTYLIMKTYQSIGWYDEVPFPLAWTHGARSLYGTPLVAEFDGLDPRQAMSFRLLIRTCCFLTTISI